LCDIDCVIDILSPRKFRITGHDIGKCRKDVSTSDDDQHFADNKRVDTETFILGSQKTRWRFGISVRVIEFLMLSFVQWKRRVSSPPLCLSPCYNTSISNRD